METVELEQTEFMKFLSDHMFNVYWQDLRKKHFGHMTDAELSQNLQQVSEKISEELTGLVKDEIGELTAEIPESQKIRDWEYVQDQEEEYDGGTSTTSASAYSNDKKLETTSDVNCSLNADHQDPEQLSAKPSLNADDESSDQADSIMSSDESHQDPSAYSVQGDGYDGEVDTNSSSNSDYSVNQQFEENAALGDCPDFEEANEQTSLNAEPRDDFEPFDDEMERKTEENVVIDIGNEPCCRKEKRVIYIYVVALFFIALVAAGWSCYAFITRISE